MVRIVICAGHKAKGLHLREAIDAYAQSRGIANISVLVVTSREELAALLERLRPGFFSIAMCCIDERCAEMSTQEISEAGAEMISRAPLTRFVFLSSDESHARCAYSAGGQFLSLPLEQEVFERVIGSALDEARRAKRRVFAVKSGKTVINLNLDDVLFVEVGKKGPVIHLPESTVLVTRMTLQALFERLSQASSTFMKVGSSFIVNLENMSIAGETSAIFGDGETIILPVRLRKAVRDALKSYRMQQ